MESLQTNHETLSILFIFDKSGSMESMEDEPRQSLNTFYETQKATGIPFKSTLILFNNNVVFVHKNLEGDKVPILEKSDYIPQGMTCLLDAIGTGITYQREHGSSNNVIVVILTDGLENCSNLYTSKKIKELINKMENEYSWQFIYLGANQDSFKVAISLGINISSDYENSPIGINTIMKQVSSDVSRCLSDNTPLSGRRISTARNLSPDNDNFDPILSKLDNDIIFLEPPSLVRSFSCIKDINL